MPSSDKLVVLIVGCGNIAGNLDSNKLDPNLPPLTHARAYTAHPHFSVQACVDISQDKSDRFASHWGIPNAYTTIDQAKQGGIDYDVISLCSPSAFTRSPVSIHPCESLNRLPST